VPSTRKAFTINTQARLLEPAPVPGAGDPRPAHVTTLTIGCVLLQAFTTNFVLVEAQSLPEYDAVPPWPYGQALSRIWPVKQPVGHWPPSHHVTAGVFDKVVNWERALPLDRPVASAANGSNKRQQPHWLQLPAITRYEPSDLRR